MALFRITDPEKLKAELLKEARLAALEHSESARHHMYLANMYEARVKALGPQPEEKGEQS